MTALYGDIPDPVFGDIPGKFWGYPRPLFGDIPKQFLGISPRSPFLGISPKFAARPARNAEKHLGISPNFWGYPRPGFGDIPKNVRGDIPKTASGISPPISLFTQAKRQNPFGDIPTEWSGISPKPGWGYPQKSPGISPKVPGVSPEGADALAVTASHIDTVTHSPGESVEVRAHSHRVTH